MDNIKLIGLLETVLGNSYTLRNGEIAFKCPLCNHHKNKLQINLQKQKWHCWICNEGGKKLHYLLKQVNAPTDIIKSILDLVGEVKYDTPNNIKDEVLTLPLEFKSLYHASDNIIYRHALKYLNSRDIYLNEIIKYNIGYADSGIYKNRIIIPSYDKIGTLNYFIARDIFPNSDMKYKNPMVSRNIIPFELYISWKYPIVLCEGVFDAIAIKRNAIPLLGKFPSKKLILRMIESRIKDVFIALDKDAKLDALKLSNILMGYNKNVYLMNMNIKDPSEMGFSYFWRVASETKKANFSDLIRNRLND